MLTGSKVQGSKEKGLQDPDCRNRSSLLLALIALSPMQRAMVLASPSTRYAWAALNGKNLSEMTPRV